MNKTKKTALNLITDVVPLLIVSLLGIFKVKLFIQYLGNETMGLYNLFSNIMVYVSLVDGGISSAILYSLYKPNAEGNDSKLSELLTGSRIVFSKIGMIVFGIAFIVSFFVIFLIKDCAFDYWYIVLTFLLFSLSNVIAYFYTPYRELLNVKEKKWIYNLTGQGAQIVLSTLEIVMLVTGWKFGYILLMHSVVRLISHIIEQIICRKLYPHISFHNPNKDFSFKKYLNSLIFHKINGLISSNIDTVIISSFLGLGQVAIYSTYHYIVNMLKKFTSRLSGSMTAIIGNGLVKDKERMYEVYKEFNGMLFYVAIVVCVPLILSINGFIDIFYEGRIATSMIVAIAFSLILFMYTIKLNTVLYVTAGGLYKETKHCAIVDTIVNLVLSLVLVHFVGISGVLFATAISVFIAEYIMKTIVVHKNVFNRSARGYFVNNIKFFIVFVLDFIGGYYIVNLFTISHLSTWFVFFIIFTFINGLLIFIIFKIFKETKFIGRIKMLKRRA
jgi:O-antigen/teichoic acid export membrane protein